jgi:hypothetical protein
VQKGGAARHRRVEARIAGRERGGDRLLRGETSVIEA